jgi:hypothetical protein
MNKFLIAATAAAAFAVAPAANAATFIVSGGTLQAVPGNNDFKSSVNGLASLGLTQELIGAKVDLSAGTTIRFEFLGTESYYSDTFLFDGVGFKTETYTGVYDAFSAPEWVGNGYNPVGAFLASFSSNGSDAMTANALGGSAGFTVFLDSAGGYNNQVLYFGYDDVPKFVNGSDDNHDDIIIRATIVPVPEPTTWALMVAGIAAVGFSMRRRSQTVRIAFS